MDQQKRYPDEFDRKYKKKKHDRSRSRSQHKKKKHSRSRSQKRKDKKKNEKKSQSKHRHSGSEERINKSKDRKDKQKQKQRWGYDDKYKKSQQRQDKHKKQKKQKKDKYNESKDQKKYQRVRSQRKIQQKQKSIQKSKKRQSKFQKSHSPYKSGDRKNQRFDDRKDEKKDYDKYDQRKTKQHRAPSKWDDYENNKRDDRRRDDMKDNYRDDKRNRDDKRSNYNRFRFDSPPKSDESDMSEDPEKMDKLNRMKAAKELVTSKADRKLYLGNLPPNITSQQLMDMLNAALKKMEINTDQAGDSIISAWISPDGVGHYAFVQFRSAQQATNGLTLNGASLFGYQLKLGRPKQYIQYNKQLLSQFGTDSNIDTIIKKVAAMGGQISQIVAEKIICPPTKILVLKHIATIEELAIDEEYQQIHDDILDMAKRFGDVKSITIPRPHQVIDLQQVQTRVKGLGYIFIQYKNADQSKYARKQFISKQFSQRSVACSYLPQKKFNQKQLDIQQKVIIQF